MKDWLPTIVTIAALSLVQRLFGVTTSLWVASVLLAYCIGVFWGAGDQIRKHKERTKVQDASK